MKKYAAKSKDTIPFTSNAVNDAIAALKNIISPNRSDNKKDTSAPRVNLTLPKEESSSLPRLRRLSRLAQNNAKKFHLQIYSRGTNV